MYYLRQRGYYISSGFRGLTIPHHCSVMVLVPLLEVWRPFSMKWRYIQCVVFLSRWHFSKIILMKRALTKEILQSVLSFSVLKNGVLPAFPVSTFCGSATSERRQFYWRFNLFYLQRTVAEIWVFFRGGGLILTNFRQEDRQWNII